MSIFSVSKRKSDKLESSLLKNINIISHNDKKNTAGEKCDATSYKQDISDDLTWEEIKTLDKDLFKRVEYRDTMAEKTSYSDYSYLKSTIRIFFKNPMVVIMLTIVVVIVLFTFIQPYLPRQYDPNLIHNNPNTGIQIRNQKPSKDFWFGTNSIGQDLWARLWAGTRTSLFIGFSVALIQTISGICIGVLWGYINALDFIFTEIYNIVDNIPSTIMLILVSYIMRPTVKTIIIAMCITGWLGVARFIRNQVIIIRDHDFNIVSQCLGTPIHRIIIKNLLPHMVSVSMLRMTLAVPGAIGSEVFLTYIGLGLPQETPSLGNLVNTGRGFMMSPSLRYQLLFPASILSIITICFYLIGNALSDAADPKNHI